MSCESQFEEGESGDALAGRATKRLHNSRLSTARQVEEEGVHEPDLAPHTRGLCTLS